MRHWRRTRPFWGGLLLIIAGFELLAIPLSGILVHGQVKLVVYIGIGGVFGVLIGALQIACGLLLWFTPAHRTFYAIAGVLLAVISFITSNLGGFFLGMLLGITGGSLAFAWTPGPPPVSERAARPSRLAAAALPAVLLGSLFGGGHASIQQAQRAQGCILGILCWPSSPSPSPSPSPSSTGTSGSGSSGSSGGGSGTSGAGGQPSPAGQNKTAPADAGLVASTSTAVITAGSATLNGLSYRGSVKVPVAGGTQTMMKFTLDSLTLAGGVNATVTENGQTTVTQNSSLVFTGGVTLYATKLSGSLLGVQLTLTPDTAVSLLLRLLNTVTPLVPVTLTNVTTDQPLVLSGALQANDLVISG